MPNESGRPNRNTKENAPCSRLIQAVVSDTPSYHSTIPNTDAAPLYTPRRPISSAQSTIAVEVDSHDGQRRQQPARLETIGLPPVPARPPTRVPPQFSFPMGSAADTPTARHYRKVAERRVFDGRYQTVGSPERQRTSRLLEEQNAANDEAFRPLEDPYLVGEHAAAEARRERLAREGSDATLQQEERQWDWLIGQYKLCQNIPTRENVANNQRIAQMRGWEERERSWTRIRGEADALQRRRLSRRVGQRISLMH